MQSPSSPIFLNLGFIKIHYYGAIMAFAIAFGYIVTKYIAIKHYKNLLNLKILSDLFPIITIAGILGGRFYYVIVDYKYYIHHISEIPAIWLGGLSIHGAILGGFLGGLLYLKYKHQKILIYADVFAYGLLLGQAIGRWGNYFNIEAYGLPTNLPWKMFVPIFYRDLKYLDYEYFHPAFLYEFLWNLLCFFVLYFVLRRFIQKYEGVTFFVYLILYSIGRIFIENLRIDSVLYVFNNIPVAIFVSIIIIVLSVLAICFIFKNNITIVKDKWRKCIK